MRHAWTRGLFLALALGASTSFAARIREFDASPQSADALAQERAAAKGHIDAYGRDVPVTTKPFPWMAAGLALIAICVCMPFGLRMYRNMSHEIQGAQAFGVKNRE